MFRKSPITSSETQKTWKFLSCLLDGIIGSSKWFLTDILIQQNIISRNSETLHLFLCFPSVVRVFDLTLNFVLECRFSTLSHLGGWIPPPPNCIFGYVLFSMCGMILRSPDFDPLSNCIQNVKKIFVLMLELFPWQQMFCYFFV